MPERPSRLQRIILSPGVSTLVGLAGLLLMLAGAATPWLTLGLTAAISAAMVYEIKARGLFRGFNFPFAGLFPLLQAAMMPDSTGAILAAVALVSLIMIMLCFSRPDATRVFFTVFLICGLGALGSRSFAFLALLMLLAIILVRAFSMRGFVASVLGFITPAILCWPLSPETITQLPELYSEPFLPGYDSTLIVIAGMALLSGLATFLPSYGYPAKSRARNMAMLGLTAGAIALPFLDFANAASFSALLNLCCAYNLTHLASLKRFGWIYVALACTCALTLVILQP